MPEMLLDACMRCLSVTIVGPFPMNDVDISQRPRCSGWLDYANRRRDPVGASSW